MKFFRLFFTILLLIPLTAAGQNTAWPVETCAINPIDDPDVRGRAFSVLFPDRREITVVGHMHGDRPIDEIEAHFRRGTLSTMNDENFQNLLATLAEEEQAQTQLVTSQFERDMIQTFRQSYGVDVSDLIDPATAFNLNGVSVGNHARQDYDFLMRRLRSPNPSQRPQFVGREWDRTEIDQWVRHYQIISDAFMFEAQNRRSQGAHHLDNRRLIDLLRASMNANLFAYVVNRDLHQSVPLVSAENSQAVEEYLSGNVYTEDEAARIDELLLQEANRHGGPGHYIPNHPQVLRFAVFLQYIQRRSTRMDFSSYGELQNLLAQLRSMAPTFSREALSDFEEATRERFRLMSNRDRHSAQNLAAQGTSGIHFVGLNHVRQTILHLRHLCLAEQQAALPLSAPRAGSESRF